MRQTPSAGLLAPRQLIGRGARGRLNADVDVDLDVRDLKSEDWGVALQWRVAPALLVLMAPILANGTSCSVE